jgi:septal ring factor EnvC (AmiA/AmiB activator)
MVVCIYSNQLRQDGNYEQQHLSAELTALRVQKQEAQAELAAVTHHRTVLRETIDQLDRRLAAHVETISDLKLQLQMGS